MDVRYDSHLYTLDFSKVSTIRAGKGMQNAIITLADGSKVVIGINRTKNPHKLYVLTTDVNKRWMGNREV